MWLLPYCWGRIVLSRVSANWVAACITTAAVAAAILAIAEFATGSNPFHLVPGAGSSIWGAQQIRGGLLRAEGAFGHSIALGRGARDVQCLRAGRAVAGMDEGCSRDPHRRGHGADVQPDRPHHSRDHDRPVDPLPRRLRQEGTAIHGGGRIWRWEASSRCRSSCRSSARPVPRRRAVPNIAGDLLSLVERDGVPRAVARPRGARHGRGLLRGVPLHRQRAHPDRAASWAHSARHPRGSSGGGDRGGGAPTWLPRHGGRRRSGSRVRHRRAHHQYSAFVWFAAGLAVAMYGVGRAEALARRNGQEEVDTLVKSGAPRPAPGRNPPGL